MADKKTLTLVQLLRGLASLLVVLMHATIATKEIWRINFLGGFFTFGGAGVDMFFVLSGFIITYTSKNALKKSASFIAFLKRRFIRIYPVYWVIITIFLLIQLALPAFYKTHYILTLSNLFNTYFLLPDHVMLNSVSWTLTYEIFFYILFSLAFLIKSNRLLITLTILYVIILIVAPFYSFLNLYNNRWINIILYPMNIEFFMGIAVALLVPRINFNISKLLILLGLLFFITAAYFSNADFYIFKNAFNRVIVFGIPSMILLLGVVRMEITKQYKVHNIFLYLGEASYSLYLIHLPILVAGIKILDKFNFGNNIILQIVTIFLIIIICSISILFFKKIEQPLIYRLNKKSINEANSTPIFNASNK